MGPLFALALGTPVWGFALAPPVALPSFVAADLGQIHMAPLDQPFRIEPEADLDAMARARTMMDAIRGAQIATNLGMAATFVLGTIAFADRYGFAPDAASTACATGSSVLHYCEGTTPVANLVAAGATGAFALTIFVLWTETDLALAEQLDGDLRLYAITRVLARVMNAVGAVVGLLLWNAVDLGWANEERDFGVLQGVGAALVSWNAATLVLETANTALVL